MKNLLQILSAFTIFSMTSFLAVNVYAGPVDPGGVDMGRCVQHYGEGTNRTSVCYDNGDSDSSWSTRPDTGDAVVKRGAGSGRHGLWVTYPGTLVGTTCQPQGCSEDPEPANNPVTEGCESSTERCYDGNNLVYSCSKCKQGYETWSYTATAGKCEVTYNYCVKCEMPADCEPGTSEKTYTYDAYTTTTTTTVTWDQNSCDCKTSTSSSSKCNAGYFGSGSNCTKCPSDYPNGGGNGTEDTSCYRDCSVDCVEDESWCPDNATCTYGNEKSDGTIHYPDTECPAEAQTCSVKTITCNSGYQKYNDNSDVCVLCDANGHVNSENKCLCNAGYYGTDGSCSPCPGLDDGDVTSLEGATAIEQCYIKHGIEGKDMTGTFTYTNPGESCSYKKTE